MSIEGIAAAAGVGKQTIYRWWPSKAALVLTWAPEVQQQLTFPNAGDLAADLKAQITSVIRPQQRSELSGRRFVLCARRGSARRTAGQPADRTYLPASHRGGEGSASEQVKRTVS